MTETLTDKRCRSRARSLNLRLAEIYDRADLCGGADFWLRVDAIDKELSVQLAKRPITEIEISQACTAAERAFTLALRDEQARARAEESRA